MAAVTAGIGIATTRQAKTPLALPLAIVPLLFAAQQLVEGALWLQLAPVADAAMVGALSFAYLLFAKVLWPTYTGVAVLLIEPDRRRHRLLCILVLVGLGLSVDLFIDLLHHPAVATIRGHSIAYAGAGETPAPPSLATLALQSVPYFVATGLPLFVSSHKAVRFFGTVVLLGSLVAASIYLTAFVSVWCFFAAAGSALLYFYFRDVGFSRRLELSR